MKIPRTALELNSEQYRETLTAEWRSNLASLYLAYANQLQFSKTRPTLEGQGWSGGGEAVDDNNNVTTETF